MFVLGAGALAASVDPVLFDPWEAGNASFECEEAGCNAEHGYKIDGWAEAGSMNGTYVTDGNTITISHQDGYTFNWSSEWPVTCVIVKAAGKANVFYYEGGAYSDADLYAPPRNLSIPGDTYEISHVTFCYNATAPPPPTPDIPALPLLAIPAGMAAAGIITWKNRRKS